MRTLSFYQRQHDAREPADDVECDGGMVPCGRCGMTGVDPLAGCVVDPWESDSCRDCSGDGYVTCSGCSECGRGERPEVCDE